MKTLQLFFLFLPGWASRTPPLPAPLARSSSTRLADSGGGWGGTLTLLAQLGKGWRASRANYISHHAQHCGPHKTKKEVDSFTWIPGGGRGPDRRLRWRLFA